MSGTPSAKNEHAIVAIDGPAASGKSSVARTLAQRLGAAHLNSGLTYRAATRAVLSEKIDPGNPAAISDYFASAEVRCEPGGDDGMRIFIGGIERVGLSDDDVNASVSQVSSIPLVRERMVAIQRKLSSRVATVVEGRDIGSVVFPDTPYKFYIDASPEVRASRRAAQGLTDSVVERDRADSSRASSPLLVPDDATIVDSSNLSIDGVVDSIMGVLRERGFPGLDQ